MTIALSDWQKKMQYTLLFIFFIQGIYYTGFLPLWEGFDEPAHFAYIQHLAENKEIPVLGKSFASQEIVISIISLPVNWNLGSVVDLTNWTSYSKYWSSNISASNSAYNKIKSLPPSMRSSQSNKPSLLIWEAQQAPLYYLISAPIYLLFYATDLFVRVFVLRLFSVILVTIALFILFKTTCELFEDYFMRFGTLIFVALSPMFAVTIARVGNQSLTILLFSLFFYLVVKFLKTEFNIKVSALLGFVIGLGLLTRATFVVTLILALLLFFLKFWQDESKIRDMLKHLLITFSIASLGLLWYIRNLILYNNFSGISNMPKVSLIDLYQVALDVKWFWYWREVFLNYWGLFGWSFIRVSDAYYMLFLIITLISLLGLFKSIFFAKESIFMLSKRWKIQTLIIFIFSIFFMCISLVYFNLNYYIILSDSIVTNGYYFYDIFPAITILLILGIRNITPIRYRMLLLFIFYISMSIYDLIILFKYLIPIYYW